MKTRKELIEQMNKLRAQVEAVEQQMKDGTPQPVEQSGLRFSPTALGGLIVSFDRPGWSQSVPANIETTIELRDMLLALHPLDPAPDAGWVSVEERLPETDKPVLALVVGRPTAVFMRENGSWFVDWNHDKIGTHPTHWRELPAPPAK